MNKLIKRHLQTIPEQSLLCDLAHNLSHHGIAHFNMPCLTGNSFVYSLRKARPLMPDEFLLPHGLALDTLDIDDDGVVRPPWDPRDLPAPSTLRCYYYVCELSR